MSTRNRLTRTGAKSRRHGNTRLRRRIAARSTVPALNPKVGFDYDLDKEPYCPSEGDQIVESVLQTEYSEQGTYVTVIVRDSAQVEILNSDFQAALSLQVTLQLALAIILSVAIADDAAYTRILNEIVDRIHEVQLTRRVIEIENSYNVQVQVVATELAFNLQLLLQLMLAIVAKLEVA